MIPFILIMNDAEYNQIRALILACKDGSLANESVRRNDS